jgi:cell division protein FtsI/penicillin-binding protein 2
MDYSGKSGSGKENRHTLILGIVLVVLALFLFRLLSIQILDNEYSELAQQNAIRRVNAYAPRGVIFDRQGRKIVVNRPIYDHWCWQVYCELIIQNSVNDSTKPKHIPCSGPVYCMPKFAWKTLHRFKKGYTISVEFMQRLERSGRISTPMLPTF